MGLLSLNASGQWSNNHENSANYGIGFLIKNNGLGLTYFKNFSPKSEPVAKLTTFDLVTVKHHREVKIINQGAQNPKPYVYGKLYHTAFARAGYGYRKKLIETNQNNNVGIDLQGVIGPTLSIRRPVYIDVMTFQLNDQIATIRSQRFDKNVEIDQNDIVGYSNKSKGWDELKFGVGVGVRPSLNFYWGAIESTLKNVQIGAMIDYFPGGMKVMAFGENPKVYASPFVSFMWSFRQ